MPSGRFLFWGFRAPREALRASFGSLERRVMEVAWQHGEVSVRDVHAELGGASAYTTLMTTLDRLHKKGVLARRKAGRAYLYSPRASREELERSVASDLLEGLLGQGRAAAQPVLSSLVDVVGQKDRALLDELEQLIREKRRRLQRKGR
jgi:predicted transcriptional regulator